MSSYIALTIHAVPQISKNAVTECVPIDLDSLEERRNNNFEEERVRSISTVTQNEDATSVSY